MQFPLKYANRHGLITGSTGGGKTYTLASMAEHFSRNNVAVLMVDAKGDLEGLAANDANKVQLWDCMGEKGNKVSLSLHDLGTELLTRALELSEAQSGGLDVAFTIAEMNEANIHTLHDLRAALAHTGKMDAEMRMQLGSVTQTSATTITRALLKLERAGGKTIFDGARFDVAAFMAHGIHIMHAVKLAQSPALYSAVVVHILNEFYTRLEEAGDISAPRLAIFIDEAHLLFTDAPQGMVRRIEQITRLIRSKGVGLYYVTQSPSDIPRGVLGQLANRVQHRMSGATQADQRAIRAAAETLPLPQGTDGAQAIRNLGIGEALCSFITNEGKPGICQRVSIPAPSVKLGLLDAQDRAEKFGRYIDAVREDIERRAMVGAGGNETLAPLRTSLHMAEMVAGMVCGAALVLAPVVVLVYWLA